MGTQDECFNALFSMVYLRLFRNKFLRVIDQNAKNIQLQAFGGSECIVFG